MRFRLSFLTARLSLRQMWLLSLLKTCFQVSSVWCFAMVSGGTETMKLILDCNTREWVTPRSSRRKLVNCGRKMASQKYIYEIKRARGEPVTSWINRSDEALMDIRKKLATAPGANSSESTMIPPQNQGWLLLHSEIERSGHCWSHDHDRRQLEHQTC